MTPSPPDVQNVPDVWGLLEQARASIYRLFHQTDGQRTLISDINAALAQRDRFALVPKEPTEEMLYAMHHKIDFHRSDQHTDKMEHESQTSCDDGMGGIVHAGTTIKQDMIDAYEAALVAAPKGKS